MLLISLFSLLIVAFYLTLRVRWSAAPGHFLLRFFGLALASALAENTVLHLYGFYAYHRDWWLFVDQVPLLVAIIWPVVILSAGDIAQHAAGPSPRRRATVGALIVLSDAALIEPVAVHAGLWSWHAPGLFAVPPIALLGWGMFAFLALRAVAPPAADCVPRCGCRYVPALLLAPLLIHPLLLASWWGGLRWVNVALPAQAVTLVAWGISLALTLSLWRKRPAIPLRLLLIRLPAALFFFVLLALTDPPALLVAYAAAFALPYSALIARARRPHRPQQRSHANYGIIGPIAMTHQQNAQPKASPNP